MRSPPCFDDPETRKRIRELCKAHDIDVDLLKDLCEVMHSYSGSGRREGVTADITAAIDSYLGRGV